MPFVSMIISQNFAGAAGLRLTPDGELLDGQDVLLRTKVKDGRIPAEVHHEILGIVALRVPDRAAISVRHARALDFDKVGAVALACKAARNVDGVLQRVARYHTLLSDSVRYHLDERGAGKLLRQEILGGSGPGLVFSPEAGLSALFGAVDQVAIDKITPDLVTFRHAPPRDAHLFEEFFGCPVEFEAEADGILFSQETLQKENRLGDNALSDFLTQHLDAELAKMSVDPTLVQATKEEIGRTLSAGPPKMADVARTLGFSVRSLHRRLADHGVTFQTLTEETRRDIALSMLREDSRPFSEIAFLTGFSEQSAFNRAFKRWTNQTPANYRKSLAS